jgi:hypothetical protein
MVDQARNGTSIKHQEQSDLELPTNHSISTTLVKETICNTTLPHQNGGKCSSIEMVTSPMSKMVRSFPSRTERMKKVMQFGHQPELVEDTDIHPKDGEFPIFTRRMLENHTPRRVK